MTTYTTPHLANGLSDRNVRSSEKESNTTRARTATPVYKTAAVSDEGALLADAHTPDWQPNKSGGVPKVAIGVLGAALIGAAAVAALMLAPSDKVTKTVNPAPIATAATQDAAASAATTDAATDAAVSQMNQQAPAAGPATAAPATTDDTSAQAATPAPVARTPVITAPVARVPHRTHEAPVPVVTPPVNAMPAPVVTPAQPVVTPSPAPQQPDSTAPAMQQIPAAPTVTPATPANPAPTPDTGSNPGGNQ